MNPPATQPVPGKAKARIQALDVIRGVSILGVLAVNADGFAAPISASLKPENWPFPNQGWTAISYWAMDAFFHDKFITLFSMLFGISLFLVGGEITDARRNRILTRRLAALFGFAMLHGFGIWWGDILSMYAVTGIVMFFCRSWRPKTLLAVGVILFAGMACRELPTTPFPTIGTASRSEAILPDVPPASAAEARRLKVEHDFAEAKNSWSGAYAVNTRAYVHQLTKGWTGIPLTLGLMMIGLSLFKSGFFAGRSSSARYLAAVAAGLPALVAVAWITWTKDVSGVAVRGTDFFLLALSPAVSLAYAAGLILILRGRGAKLLAPFAATGRMAFTNYLTQSILMTTIFYGGRGALMGQVDRPALWGIVFAVWLLQLTWSPLWLSRFEMGPFEWLWRWLTYGKRPAFIKQV